MAFTEALERKVARGFKQRKVGFSSWGSYNNYVDKKRGGRSQ